MPTFTLTISSDSIDFLSILGHLAEILSTDGKVIIEPTELKIFLDALEHGLNERTKPTSDDDKSCYIVGHPQGDQYHDWEAIIDQLYRMYNRVRADLNLLRR